MQNSVSEIARETPQGRRDLPLIIGFGLFSYVLLSSWGALVADSLAVFISERRLVACTVGAVLFWLALRVLRGRQGVSRGEVVATIVLAGLAILAFRLGLDQLSPVPVAAQHSIRWSLAWSGYFGIWLLAAVPVGGPAASGTGAVEPGDLVDPYLDILLETPEQPGAPTR